MRFASLSSRLSVLVLLSGLLFLLGACSNTGTVGTISITDRFNDSNIPALKAGSVTASCYDGEQMVGGGYAVTTTAYSNTLSTDYPVNLYPVVADYPSSTISWTASLLNRVQGSTLLLVHVECVSKSVGIQIVSASGNIDANPVTAICPAKTALTSGGWRVTNINQTKDVVTILSSLPGANNSWSVKARPARNSTATTANNKLASYVVCAANTLSSTQGAAVQFSAPPGLPDVITPGLGHASCGSGQLLSGAGFRIGDTDGNLSVALFFPSYNVSPAQWAITMVSIPNYTIDGQQVNGGGSGEIVPMCVEAAG